MQPNLPVRDSHDDVTDLKVFLLPNGAHFVLWGGWVSYRVLGYIGLSYFWSTSPGSSPRGSGTWQSMESLPSLFTEVTRRGGTLMKNARTEGGNDPDANGRTSLENLAQIRVISLIRSKPDVRISRTIPTFRQCRS